VTLLTYVTPRATRTTGIDPDLVPGPPPRSLSVVECSDGYVVALVYPGNVGCVLSLRARRCYGHERRDDVGPRVVAQLREVGVLVEAPAAVWAGLGWGVAVAAELQGRESILRNRQGEH